jgi:hypothetical protein
MSTEKSVRKFLPNVSNLPYKQHELPLPLRTASLIAPLFKNFPHLMFNFKHPKSIIISILSYMYLRLSSAYSSNVLLLRETSNIGFTLQESSHLHLWVLMYSNRRS